MNDVQRDYNSFEQLITEYQEYTGAVDKSASVNVKYQYADGSSNTIRPAALVYPNGRVLHYDYGASGGMDDALSRIVSLIDTDGSTHLVDYTRIGSDTFVQQVSPEPQIAWSVINGSGGDPYTGLDQFNRVVDNRWYSTAMSADIDRIQHGYDRTSNRLYRKNTVAEAAGVNLDELYGYDGVNRLSQMQRGRLNATSAAIVSGTLAFAQAWGLDATGNWSQFWENDSGSSWNLQQTRAASRSNEITAITGGGWVQPAYDAAGNMVQAPDGGTLATAGQANFDAWNRMMTVSRCGSLVQQSAYDAENRRVSRITSGTTHHYYYSSDWQDLEERLSTTASPDAQFVWGLRYIDDLLVRDRASERFYTILDPNWNVTGIANLTGTVSERYGYSAYGEPAFMNALFSLLSSSAYEWDVLFAGYRWLAEVSLYYVRHRDLRPLLGFWISREPKERLNEMNLYEYCSGSPVLTRDPSGLEEFRAFPEPGCDNWNSSTGDNYGHQAPKIRTSKPTQ